MARSLGGSYRELRKGLNEFQEHMRVADLDRPPVKPKAIEHDEEESYAPSAYLPAPDADPAVAVERAEWNDDTSERLIVTAEVTPS